MLIVHKNLTTETVMYSCYIRQGHCHLISVHTTAILFFNPVLHEIYQNVHDDLEHFLVLFILSKSCYYYCYLPSNVTIVISFPVIHLLFFRVLQNTFMYHVEFYTTEISMPLDIF